MITNKITIRLSYEELKQLNIGVLRDYLEDDKYILVKDTRNSVEKIVFENKIDSLNADELYEMILNYSYESYDGNFKKLTHKKYKYVMKRYSNLVDYRLIVFRGETYLYDSEKNRSIISFKSSKGAKVKVYPGSSLKMKRFFRDDIPVFHTSDGKNQISFLVIKPFRLGLKAKKETRKIEDFGFYGVVRLELSEDEILTFKSSSKRKQHKNKDFTDEQKIKLYKRMRKFIKSNNIK